MKEAEWAVWVAGREKGTTTVLYLFTYLLQYSYYEPRVCHTLTYLSLSLEQQHSVVTTASGYYFKHANYFLHVSFQTVLKEETLET